ncbi:MAG: VOC family protein [Cyanobacteria bacterium J06626_14]
MTMDCKEVFVALAANDFAAVVEFYHHVFEAEPTAHMPDRYAEFRLSGIKLGIFKPQPSHVDEFAQSSGAGLSLCVEVSDLDSAIAHLEHLGYQPPDAVMTASHGREAYVYDPAGNRLILHESRS